ncbi:uncharacterized protein LOC106875438 [Octopus bimaculoides]|uniref:uncharacterized protein LOC106875438 n=1 Tax=Octopus bimaculoides TaxID=37653 RepID=UPI00071C3816|nr:uncharacterized protein LOC106875438 [Octopus bimaculoides]|eukprot:XP_014779078.1 PREDICTED: uncharacterized protein LOC106875438 [Octopus bimaculoides]
MHSRVCVPYASQKGDIKSVFRLVKELSRKRKWTPRSDVINDKEGNILTEEENIKAKWMEYSTDLYRRRQEDRPAELAVAEDRELEPLKEEVRQALYHTKNGKSPGVDELPIEIWKVKGDIGIELLWSLCVKVWNDVEWTINWGHAVFVPIPKKCNPRECSNHRTISLIVHTSKILLRIIVGRLQRKYNSVIAEERAGFVKGRGTRNR